jgi:hypothetical protein
MSDVNSTNSLPTSAALAVDAERIVTEVLPDLSLRTWRRMDSSGKCPRGFKLLARKLWRIEDLRQWANLGFPDRMQFEKQTAGLN